MWASKTSRFSLRSVSKSRWSASVVARPAQQRFTHERELSEELAGALREQVEPRLQERGERVGQRAEAGCAQSPPEFDDVRRNTADLRDERLGCQFEFRLGELTQERQALLGAEGLERQRLSFLRCTLCRSSFVYPLPLALRLSRTTSAPAAARSKSSVSCAALGSVMSSSGVSCRPYR